MKNDEIPLVVLNEYEQTAEYLRKTYDGKLRLAMASITGIDGKKELIAAAFEGPYSKDLFANLVNKKIKETFATMVTFWAESWYMTSQEDYNDYRAHPEKYKDDMGNHPKAKEVLYISIQTRKASYMGSIPILKNKKLGETQAVVKADSMGGRFNFSV